VDSLVNTVTRPELEGWVSIPGKGRYFSIRFHVQTRSGAHAASYPVSTVDFFLAHLSSSSVQVKNAGNCICLHGACLIKTWDNVTFCNSRWK
jgi:hypothetical protein